MALQQKPPRIKKVTDYGPIVDETSSKDFERTIQKHENVIGTKRIELKLGRLWSETNSIGISASIDKYFNTTFVTASAPAQ
jgi:hypothetical protein